MSKLPRGLHNVLYVGEQTESWTDGNLKVTYFQGGDYWRWELGDITGSAPDPDITLHELAELGYDFTK